MTNFVWSHYRWQDPYKYRVVTMTAPIVVLATAVEVCLRSAHHSHMVA